MPALIERPKMTRTMYQALKRHIMRERDKKKLELEQDAAYERTKKEREMRKKKEQEDSLTLEQTKEQISQLERKLELLKEEKHQLFSQLKKVLHQEDETRRRAQIKEHNELVSMGQHYQQNMASTAMFLQTGHLAGRPTMYKPAQHMIAVAPPPQGLKRPRSPSPPPASIYHQYAPDAKYGQFTHAQGKQPTAYQPQQKQSSFQQSAAHVYGSQPSHSYAQQTNTYSGGQSAGGKYPPSSQSAFSSYPGHYSTPKQLSDHYPGGYSVSRIQQPRYMSGPHTAGLPLQQQLDHTGQKSGFSDDKYKIQQAGLRGMATMAPQQTLISQQIHVQQQQAQPKGGIVSGFPVRTQSSPAYQSPQPGYSTQQQNGSQRHSYHSGQQRYF